MDDRNNSEELLYGVPPMALVEGVQILRNDRGLERRHADAKGAEARHRVLREALQDTANSYGIKVEVLMRALGNALQDKSPPVPARETVHY